MGTYQLSCPEKEGGRLLERGTLFERGGLIEDLRGSRESAHKGQLH